MRDFDAEQAGHIGIYVFTNYAPHVLHTSHKLGRPCCTGCRTCRATAWLLRAITDGSESR
jgi:hypothetical protein